VLTRGVKGRKGEMPKKIGRVAAILVLAALMVVSAGPAWANDDDPKTLGSGGGGFGRVVPGYDITTGKTSILIFSTPRPGVTSTAAIANARLWFYDATCARKLDLLLPITPNDVHFINLALVGGLPTQGAVLAATTVNGLDVFGPFPAGTNLTLDTLQVDFARDHAWLEGSGHSHAADWTPWDSEAFIPIVPIDDGTVSRTNFRFSCPIFNLGADMNTVDPPGIFPTATTARTLSMLVFDTSEKPLASVHGCKCSCYTTTRPSTLFGGAATQDTHWQIAFDSADAFAGGEEMTLFYDTEIHTGSINVLWNGRPYRID